MTRAEVVRLTRLSPLAIEALEEERCEGLPARVFVGGYLRLYATAIGRNPDEAVLRFEEWTQANPEVAPPPPEPAVLRRPERRRFPWKRAGAVALAVAVHSTSS